MARKSGLLAALCAVGCFSTAAAGNAAPISGATWQHETDDAVPDKGLVFTVPGIDDLADFHGDPAAAELSLYVGGNYYFLMPRLAAAFTALHPEFSGRMYWETLPPGLLLDQIRTGGLVTSGNLTWRAPADAFLAGIEVVEKGIADRLLVAPALPYVTNTLAIMVPRANPANIHSLADLGRQDVRLSMPNPAFEGVARQIRQSLIKAGGEALAAQIYTVKQQDGTTFLTRIHHRQTPMRLLLGQSDAGVVWQSEARYLEAEGQDIAHIDIPAAQNTTGVYAGAVVKGAPHQAAAQLWLDFLRSPDAARIFAGYGFGGFRSP